MIFTALSKSKRPPVNQTSITEVTVLVLPATGVGVTELFNLTVGAIIVPSQALGAVIFVPSGISTLTTQILVVTPSVISGNVAIILLHEVLTGTRRIASVTVSGIVIFAGLVPIIT